MRIAFTPCTVLTLALVLLCGGCTGQTPDCLEIESLLDASAVPIPWTRGQCCTYFTPLDVPATFRGFNCSGGRVERASLALMNLKGPLPPLTNLTELELLDVTANNFTGPFPSLRGLTKLKFLYARGNNFTTFPPELPDLVALQNVQLYNNSISGPLPNLTNLTQLFVFWVDGNNLSGSVDYLLPPSLRFCRLTFGDTNPGLFTATDQVPPACLSEGQVLPNVNRPQNTASSSSKDTVKLPNWPSVIAAIVAGAVVLLAASACFVWRAWKRRKEREVKELKEPHWFFLRTAGPLGLDNSDSVEYSGPPFSVLQSYEKQAPDEMDLTPGTTVQMQSIFRDGCVPPLFPLLDQRQRH
ncbi:L domain-like protein [Gonapodya prolifera JEL478]|uniref:L domain-like protein n=1 Tax=Gonapodya prolifera (strain JEL478) TaxID=1344416 RepID=A0A139AKV7_GONPJ|nr:L domain-like protein [Gonapodya prolifera JEL478]|eukprot:KXS17407.1 L domain-like protein [Gonapodya prolifera JEL478]